jgi:DNA-binding GntR family transcriptional regulator
MPRLLAVIDDLHAASARFLFASWSSGWVTPKDKDHRSILTHLREQKTEQAVTVLDRHVQRIGHRRKESPAAPERFAIVG